MTEITDPDFGTVDRRGQPGVRVRHGLGAGARPGRWTCWRAGVEGLRAAAAFTAGGRHFKTGAALVDGATLGAHRPRRARGGTRETPVYGLPRYPVDRYQLVKPKIGDLHAAARPGRTRPARRRTRRARCSGGYCEALFVLTQKMRIPASTDLRRSRRRRSTAGELVNRRLHRVRQPGDDDRPRHRQRDHADARRSRTFVNAGGRYIGTSTNGTTTRPQRGPDARQHAGDLRAISTPGSIYDGAFDTTSPLAWGYRHRRLDLPRPRGQRQLRPGDAGRPAARIPAPKVAGALRRRPRRQRPRCTSTASTSTPAARASWPAAPAMIDQPFGAGRALLFGVNPFYRAWIDGEERLVAQRHPVPDVRRRSRRRRDPPQAPAAAMASPRRPAGRGADRRGEAAGGQSTARRPVGRSTVRDLRITVKRSTAKALPRRGQAGAAAPSTCEAKVRYSYTREDGDARHAQRAARDDPHARNTWVIRDHGQPASARSAAHRPRRL